MYICIVSYICNKVFQLTKCTNIGVGVGVHFYNIPGQRVSTELKEESVVGTKKGMADKFTEFEIHRTFKGQIEERRYCMYLKGNLTRTLHLITLNNQKSMHEITEHGTSYRIGLIIGAILAISFAVGAIGTRIFRWKIKRANIEFQRPDSRGNVARFGKENDGNKESALSSMVGNLESGYHD